MPTAAKVTRPTHFRWFICALLFLATTINYMDRQIIGILKTTLMDDLKWRETDYANIVTSFQAAYAAGYLTSGWAIDIIGVKLGYALAVFFWSLAAIAHGPARSILAFASARAGLGLAEGGNFPAAVKATAEWFPKKERALATGIFNAGSNIGALITPLVVPWITLYFGWPAAFISVGTLGFIWLALWIFTYAAPAKHPLVNPAELAFIHSDKSPTQQKIPWHTLLTHRQTWAFALGMLFTAPVWWFYLFWIPDFLHKRHGLDLTTIGPPLVIIYLMTDIGSIGGGWLSSTLLRRGFSTNTARKIAMLVCALCVVPIAFASIVSHLWLAVFLIGLAASAHQGFSANLYTMVSDTVPANATSSVVGIGGAIGSLGGIVVSQATGQILNLTGIYLIPFLACSISYLIALTAIHVLNPELNQMDIPLPPAFEVLQSKKQSNR